ncbi:protein slit-like [Schistocerca gregaria]|uniref:protein slit-like n=1 Tax=Schistocerca gregaria TaxID=7010 RepID=UPI00211DFFE3|nr:protein slit-like [Schistocerca gregaria]
MRNSPRCAAQPPPALPISVALAAAILLLGVLASSGCAGGFTPPAACPPAQFRTGKARPLEWAKCPADCSCSSTDVQLWCRGSGLPELVGADAAFLETMVVEGLGIAKLQAHHFGHLTRLVDLTLSNGRISEIAEDAFQELSLLVRLDLSNNEIVDISEDTFVFNKNLRFLVLDGNPLHVPSSDPLFLSTSLGSLSIRGCGIESMNSQTFAGVPELYEILMMDNPLTEFPSEAISSLERLCSIDVDPRDTTNDKFFKGFGLKEILIISGVTLVMAAVLIGVYKICKTLVCSCRRKQEVVLRESLNPSNHTSSSGWTEAPVPLYEEIGDRQMGDRRSGYQIVSQRELHIPGHGYPGYVYNGIDFPRSSPRERYSYVDNVGLYSPTTKYHRSTERLPLPPPYDNIGTSTLPSRHESVATSTSDLHTLVASDDVNL